MQTSIFIVIEVLFAAIISILYIKYLVTTQVKYSV